MSFTLEFTATNPRVATKIVRQDENLPLCVSAFICQALKGCNTEQPVYVKAYGHLYSGNDYNVSSADLQVREVSLRQA